MLSRNSNVEKKNVGRSSVKATSSKTPLGKSWFFGIGINRYQYFSNLNNAVKDVKDMIIQLQDEYGLEPEQTVTLFDEAATRSNIIDKLDRLVENIGSKDKLLVYYSGHGYLHPQTQLAYWIPQDAELTSVAGYIPNSTIRDYIKSIKSLHTLLISDSCFSGSLFVRSASRSTIVGEELEQKRSRWGIVSGRQNEEVLDGEPGTNSPFAASILKVLGRNRDAKLTVGRLANQVVEMTRYNYTQLPEGNPLFGVGHDGGQYVFRLATSESNFWERCLAEHSMTAYDDYLNQFPDGLHTDKAMQYIRELKEEEEWQATKRIDQVYAYQVFLHSFPTGKHAEEARECIQKLQMTEQVKAAVSTKPYLRKYLLYAVGVFLLIVLGIWLQPKRDSGTPKAAQKKIDVATKEFPLKNADLGVFPKESSVQLAGKTYHMIQFKADGLTWMAQNLDYEFDDSWYHDSLELSERAKYGRLYTWDAAIKACQAVGWRLPSDDEWRDMTKSFGGISKDAPDGGSAAFYSLIKGGQSDFDALMGSSRNSDGNFDEDLGYAGTYWSATEKDADTAWEYSFVTYGRGEQLHRLDSHKLMGFSCRCVRSASSDH